jgi:hypothetical protein
MSKISQALEKAARERLQRSQKAEPQVNVAAPPVVVPVTPIRESVGEIPAAKHVQIDPHIISAADPKSPISEQYRILKANLQALKLRHGPKVIVITSSVHGEGKSVTSINLAMTLARQEQQRVVLIDGDMRRGSVHHPEEPVRPDPDRRPAGAAGG